MLNLCAVLIMGIDHILLRIKREADMFDAPAIVAHPLLDYGDEG